MSPTRGNPANVSLGAGYLYIAPLSSTEPTDLVSAWPGAWTLLGYTEDGSQFSYDIKAEDIMVAEEFDPVKIAVSGRTLKVEFKLAEITATNLKRASNGGTLTSGAGIVTFDPPAPSTEVRTMLGFQSEDNLERWVFRQCLQRGPISIDRKKAPNKSLIPVAFGLEKPSSTQPFKAIFDSTRP